MTGKRSKEGPSGHLALHPMNSDAQPSGRVAQAIEIYRSIASCNAYLARRDDVHALTATLMLPCYQAEFCRLARELTRVEQNELEFALGQFLDPMRSSFQVSAFRRAADAPATLTKRRRSTYF